MYIDAYSTRSKDTLLFKDFMLPAPQSDLSCWRVSAFQELLRGKEKQHMLEMQTHVIISIKGTADQKYIQNESVIHYELDHLYAL